MFNAIRDSSEVTKIDETTFEYQFEEVPAHLQKGPRWKLLIGKEIELPIGFSASGVEEGFFAPTNKENAVGQPKMEFLTDNPIKRPEFCRKAKKPKQESVVLPQMMPHLTIHQILEVGHQTTRGCISQTTSLRIGQSITLICF